MQFILGALSDKQHRVNLGPIIDEDEWNRQLLASNFSGTEIITRDSQDKATYCSSMMVTTKPGQPELAFKDLVMVTYTEASPDAQVLAQNLTKAIEDLGLSIQTATLEEATAEDADGNMLVSGKLVLTLLDIETPLVSRMTETEFSQIQKLLLFCSGGMWISRSNRAVDPAGDPEYSASVGLLRTLRNEKPEIRTHELSLSSELHISDPEVITKIMRPLQLILQAGSMGRESETETAEIDDFYYIPRLIDHKPKNRSLDEINHRPPPNAERLSEVPHPLKLDIGTPGILDTLRFVRDPLPLAKLGDNDVEIEVHANGMNFSYEDNGPLHLDLS